MIDSDTSSILAGARDRFAGAMDFTLGIEEEFQILDPVTLALANRYEEFIDAAPPGLAGRLDGELIASEIECKTRAHATFADAALDLAHGRLELCALADALDARVAITGAHPFSPWTDQRIIRTPHYDRVVGNLGYVAWINNTWAVHLHCGVRDADRAIYVCTRMREVLPELLALSANSPLYGGRDIWMASVRTQLFIRNLPRCGISDPFQDWDDYAGFVALLERTGSIAESTELWWSVRPHPAFGTVEVRICDGQTEAGHALALAALGVALIADCCAEYDDDRRRAPHPRGRIEENLWRAARYGLDGELIDLDSGDARPARVAIGSLLERTRDHHARLGLGPWLDGVSDMLDQGNGAIRQRALFERFDGDLVRTHAAAVARTRASAEEVIRGHAAVMAR
jgi:carboxylate-amine ligase